MNGSSTFDAFEPDSTAGVVEVVRAAIDGGFALRTARDVADKGRTLSDTSRPVSLGKLVTLTGLKAVVDYPARDMTITVQAGMPLCELKTILAEEKQQLPVDCFDPTMTVGALVASDLAGPRQYGYGTLRDYVIGIEAVDGHGRTFHAGGRVVKNVAGYDLCRLMVGSRGSLGILTQLTFKLKPVPEQSDLRTFRFDEVSDFDAALGRLNVTAATPVMIDFTFASPKLAKHRTGPSSDRKDLPYSLCIGVEGTEASCKWQIEQLRQDCAGGEEIDFPGSPGWSIAQHCRSSGYGWMKGDVQIRTLPSKLVAVATELSQRRYSTQGHAGNAILFAGDEVGEGQVRAVCEEVVAKHGGTVSEWDVDHPAKATDPLSTRLRATFDPHSVFLAE